MRKRKEIGWALLESAAILTVMGAVVWFGFCVTAYIQGITGLKEIINRHAGTINIKPNKLDSGNQAYFLNSVLRDTGGNDIYPLKTMLEAHAAAVQNDIRALLGCEKRDCPSRYAVILRHVNLLVNTENGEIISQDCQFNADKSIGREREVVVKRGLLGAALKESRAALAPVLRQGCGGNGPFQYAVPGPLNNVQFLQYYGQSEVREDEKGGNEYWNQKPINYLRRAPLLQLHVQVDLSGSFLDPGYAKLLAGQPRGTNRGALLFTDQRIFAMRQEL